MRKLTLILSLVFTVTLSSPSYAKWTKVGESVSGDIYYVDFESITIHGGYFMFATLFDSVKPTIDGDLSGIVLLEGDCETFRVRNLTGLFKKEPMGGGNNRSETEKNPQWIFLILTPE